MEVDGAHEIGRRVFGHLCTPVALVKLLLINHLNFFCFMAMIKDTEVCIVVHKPHHDPSGELF
jgi:hypothetical protein